MLKSHLQSDFHRFVNGCEDETRQHMDQTPPWGYYDALKSKILRDSQGRMLSIGILHGVHEPQAGLCRLACEGNCKIPFLLNGDKMQHTR